MDAFGVISQGMDQPFTLVEPKDCFDLLCSQPLVEVDFPEDNIKTEILKSEAVQAGVELWGSLVLTNPVMHWS